MTKAEFYAKVAEKTGKPLNVTKEIINASLETIGDCIKDDDGISFVGFGKFEKVWVDERESRNPRTGEKMLVKGHYKVRFSAGQSLKTEVAQIKKK